MFTHWWDGEFHPYKLITVSQKIAEVGKRVGIRVCPHDLRRTGSRITYQAALTEDTLRGLQEALGHTSIEQTKRYVRVGHIDQRSKLDRRDVFLAEL